MTISFDSATGFVIWAFSGELRRNSFEDWKFVHPGAQFAISGGLLMVRVSIS